MIQNLESGGLNMIIRILEANPDEDDWIQIPRFFLRALDIKGLNFKFNFDDSVLFFEMRGIPLVYRQALKYYNRALVSDWDFFEITIMNEPFWGTNTL